MHTYTVGMMHARRFLAPWPIVLVLAALAGVGCEAEPVDRAPVPVTTAAPTPAVHPLDRVAVVGASVSAGFGAEVAVDTPDRIVHTPIDLADVLDAGIVRDHEPVAGFGNMLFFSAPMRHGPTLLQKALDERPTVLVAVDYLFWFAYGNNGPDGEPFQDDQSRLALLEVGLGLLEGVSCPVILGDLPDMSPAIGFMLGASQVPSADALAQLNERIRDWAAERPNVVLMPVGEMVARIQQDIGVQVGPYESPAGGASELVQYDKLHPTAEGLVVTAQLVAQALVEAGKATDEDFDLHPDAVLERVREHLEKEAVAVPSDV